MNIDQAIGALGALAQKSRLDIYRLLVQTGPDGLPAGQVGVQLQLTSGVLSFHLKELAQAGLVISRRDGRSIIYSADYPAMTRLLGFLTENCCRGDLAACDVGALCEPGASVPKAHSA